jgi:hypothetical protein
MESVSTHVQCENSVATPRCMILPESTRRPAKISLPISRLANSVVSRPGLAWFDTTVGFHCGTATVHNDA